MNDITKIKFLNITQTILTVFVIFCACVSVGSVLAQTTETVNFRQEISPGNLLVDIVDPADTTNIISVTNPRVVLDTVYASASCQTTPGTFGTVTETIYMRNPDAADNGFTLSLANTSPAAVWDSAGTDFDFNDPNSLGCSDGSDTDTFGGQMTLDPSGATLTTALCQNCTTVNISLGSQAAYNEGTVDSINIVNAAADSDDIGDWFLTDVGVVQSVPPSQPVANDYKIHMTLTIAAQ